jgi:DNA-binding MarR family transcriptional regulator
VPVACEEFAVTENETPGAVVTVKWKGNVFVELRPMVCSAIADAISHLLGARPTTLAQRAGITKQAISQLVRELEARGYAEQVPDSTDTRAKIVRLTKRGVALHAASAEVRLELQSVALSKLGKSRVARLRRDLIELAAALEELRTR